MSYGSPENIDWGEGSMLRADACCSIAARVAILLGGEHYASRVSTFPFSVFVKDRTRSASFSRGDVRIGNDVWVGRDVLILSGVTIGDGAVVGARAVVARDVPPYAIVVGNPARVVRMRFTETQIENLLRIAWWRWDEETIWERSGDIMDLPVDAFIAKYL